MKQLIAALFTAVLLVTGMAGLTTSSAHAASTACPYTGCIPTKTTVKAPSKVTKPTTVVIRLNVTAAGKAAPKGQFKVVVNNTAHTYYSKSFRGSGTKIFTTQLLKHKGTYTVTVHYIPRSGSAYSPSKGSTTFKVVKK